MKYLLALALVVISSLAHAQTSQPKDHPPLVVGPVSLNCINKPCSAATITGTARGSGVNGPATAQTGMTINFSKQNWWSGGKVGEIDGLNIIVRQNAPHSDSSGILINVQNQGHGFFSATEFASTIVDPVQSSYLWYRCAGRCSGPFKWRLHWCCLYCGLRRPRHWNSHSK